MDPSTRLLSLSFAMLIGCYVFGSIPLSLTFSEKNMRSMSICGAGLIVGTALSVIIPEGVHTLYEGKGHAHTHDHDHEHKHEHEHHDHHDPKSSTKNQLIKEKFLAGLHEQLAPDVELHSMIGISLTLGFVFMLLVDHLCGGHHSHGQSDLPQRQKSVTATLGLLVHAAADGIALGAAATTTRTDIEMIVFLAIMLHKAPAAFGLSSFLLHEGYERSRIRRHLLAFSIAAPLFAVITYYGLSQTGKEVMSSMNGTGLAMLFSAGTFLYVATVHILPELIHRVEHGEDNGGKLGRRELFLLVLGILFPLVLGLYHKH